MLDLVTGDFQVVEQVGGEAHEVPGAVVGRLVGARAARSPSHSLRGGAARGRSPDRPSKPGEPCRSRLEGWTPLAAA